MNKFSLLLLLIPSFAMAEKCSGYVKTVDHRSDGALIYFSTSGFTQISGSIDTNTDPSGATNQKYVRIKYASDSVRENQLMSVLLTAFSTGQKVYVEYTYGGSPAWNVTSLAISN